MITKVYTMTVMLLSLCWVPLSIASSFDDERASQSVHNSQESFEYILKAAEQGNPEFQFTLALLYEEGKIVTQSTKEALKWFLKSARAALYP